MPANLKRGPRAVLKQTKPRGGRPLAKRQSGIVATVYRDASGIQYIDEARFRRGILRLIALDGDREYSLNKIIILLGTRPDVNKEVRDRSLGKLADLIKIEPTSYILKMTKDYKKKSTNQIAGDVADKIKQYETTRGKWDQDRVTDHTEKPRYWDTERWLLFNIMRYSTEKQGPPEQKRIADILRTYWKEKVICSNEIAVAPAHATVEAVSTQPSQAEVSAPMDNRSEQQSIVLDGLTKGPIGKDILNSEKNRIIANRTQVIEELAKLDAESARNYQLLQKAREDALEAQRKAIQAVQDAQVKINEANHAITSASRNFLLQRDASP